ncbi:MAG: glutamine synthetase type III [Ruminococcaceae bacterium]|nr:glutamine synthetase type III [Oscillospiraceae bacterium]
MYITDIYANSCFNDEAMKANLSEKTYKKLKETIDNSCPLDNDIADEVAEAMKNWATSKGATHFSHWFQPLNEMTAEKHDAFLSFDKDGHAIVDFSGKELIKGESDASSFPSGGLRATFEARGYTAWDCTSPAFVKDQTLYIPTVFCSYTGEALDKKTPLLRSMEALNTQALRVLRHLGDKDSTKVITTVGPEQEYFLIDRELYEKRLDLLLCGRTLFGSPPPKGQEMDDHYYGRLRLRISDYMHELDRELWALGVSAKTKHNEVAPAQHELACVYNTANIACDQNQITMESMRTVAKKKGLACLLHEKPFKNVSGSGKHINWSLSTDTGLNILSPGKNPSENITFLLFMAAMISGVDKYQDLLRFSCSGASNDVRLGGDEAPPTVISIFLGEELCEIYDAIELSHDFLKKNDANMNMGVLSVPSFKKDTTDRNRTSPCAFTGNKFEFRMCGSSSSVSRPSFVINAIMAEELMLIADRLDKAKGDINIEIKNIIREIIKEHKRILYNGNNYSEEWRIEAEKRGLVNIPTTVEAIEALTRKENVDLLVRHGILSENEITSRYEINLEMYSKVINIESLTMQTIAEKSIIPAVESYCGKLARDIKDAGDVGVKMKSSKDKLSKISVNLERAVSALEELKKNHLLASETEDISKRANKYKDCVIPAMEELRSYCDKLETLVPKDMWPLPDYTDLMYRV